MTLAGKSASRTEPLGVTTIHPGHSARLWPSLFDNLIGHRDRRGTDFVTRDGKRRCAAHAQCAADPDIGHDAGPASVHDFLQFLAVEAVRQAIEERLRTAHLETATDRGVAIDE